MSLGKMGLPMMAVMFTEQARTTGTGAVHPPFLALFATFSARQAAPVPGVSDPFFCSLVSQGSSIWVRYTKIQRYFLPQYNRLVRPSHTHKPSDRDGFSRRRAPKRDARALFNSATLAAPRPSRAGAPPRAHELLPEHVGHGRVHQHAAAAPLRPLPRLREAGHPAPAEPEHVLRALRVPPAHLRLARWGQTCPCLPSLSCDYGRAATAPQARRGATDDAYDHRRVVVASPRRYWYIRLYKSFGSYTRKIRDIDAKKAGKKAM